MLETVQEMQAIIDREKDRMGGGAHLKLCNAALALHNSITKFKEEGPGSEEDGEEEVEWAEGWEDGDTTAAELAEEMIVEVTRDRDNFADLVSGWDVHALTKTRRPKACALAAVHMLETLDRTKPVDQETLRKWKNLVVSLDGQGRCGYILKQSWLDDDYRNEEDSDPREAIMRVMELLIEGDANFRERLVLRGNVDAVDCLIARTDAPALRAQAVALRAKLAPPEGA